MSYTPSTNALKLTAVTRRVLFARVPTDSLKVSYIIPGMALPHIMQNVSGSNEYIYDLSSCEQLQCLSFFVQGDGIEKARARVLSIPNSK